MWVLPRSVAAGLLGAALSLLPASGQSVATLALPEVSAVPDTTACASLHDQSARAAAARDYAGATRLLQQALAVCGNRQAVLLSLGKTQMLAKQFDASARTLASLLQVDAGNEQALLIKGELDYLIDRPADAIAALLQASAVAPGDAQAHYLLGRVYYEQSSVQLALLQFQAALRLDGDAYKAYDGLALCYEAAGDTAQAAQTYMDGIRMAYRAHPEYDVVYADFAELMLRFNRSEKALELAAEAVQRNPQAARNYLLAGRALEQQGKYGDSLRWLERAAAVEPAVPDAHFELARVYRRLGELPRAAEESKRYAELAAKAPAVRR